MLIKKRLLISNILMIIVPAVLIMIVSAILYLSYVKIYEIPKGAWDADGKRSIMSQSRKMVLLKQSLQDLSAELAF